jgi:nitrate reductase NapE component
MNAALRRRQRYRLVRFLAVLVCEALGVLVLGAAVYLFVVFMFSL